MHNYRCAKCDKVTEAWSDDVPTCHRRKMSWTPAPFYTPEWGSARYIESLDETFASRSELNAYLKREGLEQAPSADKQGGARNEDHLNLGRIYSYANSPAR